MELRRISFYLLATVALSIGIFPDKVMGQISSDSTLSTTVSTDDAVNFLIEGGARSLDNLFHSFSEFSIPNLGSAYFNNATDITNIFSRVTGGNISEIQGLIRANGTANLFLINPAGIVFGENAALDVGGSFFASTAESVVFGDGVELSAIEPQEAPLLTVNITPGIQLGANPGTIVNQSINGLRAESGQTIGFIGGEITFDQGQMRAPEGRVELFSATNGTVQIIEVDNRLALETQPTVGTWQDILLTNTAEIRNDGDGGGTIQVQGRRVSLEAGGQIRVISRGTLPGGDILVYGSEEVNLDGDESQFRNRVDQTGTGNGGDIIVVTDQLLILNDAEIQTETEGAGDGGNIVVTTNYLEVSGISPIDGGLSELTTKVDDNAEATGRGGDILVNAQTIFLDDAAFFTAETEGAGDAGNVIVNTEKLTMVGGSQVSSFTFGSGDSGNVTVNADSIEIAGIFESRISPSAISAGTFNLGNAGNVVVNTGSLLLREGGRVDSSTVTPGNAGSVTVNASELVEVRGTAPGLFNPSSIISSANQLNPVLLQTFGLPPFPTGESGSVTVNTPNLRVIDGAQVTVRNDGIGDAGTLQINGGSIFLNDEAGITASTNSGEGGNIELNLEGDLLLRNSSNIITEAGGTGNGGNITINSDLVTLLESSQINANAFEGNGGNITITTQGLFVSPNSLITASSQFGVDGTITLNTPDEENKLAIAELPANLTDASQQIVGNCSWTRDNTFYVVGRRGIAKTPQEHIQDYTMWSDIRDLSNQSSVISHPSGSQSLMGEIPKTALSHQSSPRQERIVEANAWIINEWGNVELVAVVPSDNQNLGQVASSCSGEVGS